MPLLVVNCFPVKLIVGMCAYTPNTNCGSKSYPCTSYVDVYVKK